MSHEPGEPRDVDIIVDEDEETAGDADDTGADDAGDAAPVARARRLPTWALVLIGGAAGVLVGLGAAIIATRGEPSPSSLELSPAGSSVPADQQANARAFIAAWQRYRQGTFVSELTFQRTLTNGQTLTATRIMVQQPPRRVVRQLDSVSTLGGAGQVACDKVDDQTVCTPGNGQAYDEGVQNELVAWATAFAGTNPVYVVDAPEPGCYQLTLAQAMPAPPYGSVARFCFDDATGALRSRQIARDTATDTEEATRIAGTVTDADWAKAAG